MKTFRLTYQTVTRESAENGDIANHGFISRTGNYNPDRNYFPKTPHKFSLREALDIFNAHGGNVSANEWPVRSPRWIDSCLEDYNGSVTIGLHFPDSLTTATKLRICRLAGISTLNQYA